MVKLSQHPAMVICMGPRGRHWFFSSELVRNRLWPVKDIQKGSLLGDLTRRAGASRGEVVAADLWTNHRDAHEYELREDSILITDDLALTIISWPDEEQIVALMDSEG